MANNLPPEKQIAVIAALCEGMSIRAVERLTGAHHDTIMRLGVRAGEGCARLHDYLMQDIRVAIVEMDELWAFVGKKQKRTKPEDGNLKGDAYTFIAIDATNKAVLAYRTGKRNYANTEIFLADLKMRLASVPVVNLPVLTSDAFRYYEPALKRVFGNRIKYGQIIKRYADEANPETSSEASRRYSPGIVVGIDRKPVVRNPPLEAISTSHAERHNLSVRMASRRFTRLTNAFSKKLENHIAAVHLYVGHYNFCRVHEALRITPAMAVGVTDHVWSIAELLDAALTGVIEPRLRRSIAKKRPPKKRQLG